MLAIVGASGKLGLATLQAVLSHNLLPPNQIICTSSSDEGTAKLSSAQQKGVRVKRAHWDDPSSFEVAFEGCKKLFLISSSRIQKDFNDAPEGEGREADHYAALEAAERVGVKHVYYTSLAFQKPSKSRVMKAHERTEDWLKANKGKIKFTIIREGLYNESWPLYLGHYKPGQDERTEVPLAGDSKISWTSIADLGLASALILATSSDEWTGRTVYLAQSKAHTLAEVAEMVSRARSEKVRLKIVPREEHEKYYVEERGMDEAYVKWWSRTYDALREQECEIRDPTLEELLGNKRLRPKRLEETLVEMLKG